MGNVLAVVNQKGGVGKTTTAVTLAHGLAMYGKRVLLVDLDAQGHVAEVLGLRKWGGVYAWLVGPDPGSQPGPHPGPPLPQTARDCAGGAAAYGNGVVTHSGRPGLNVLLGDKRTAEAREIVNARPFREMAVREGLERLGGYDLVILDCAPGSDVLQIAALVAATEFLVPVALDHLAVIGVMDMLATATSLMRSQASGARFLGVLPTMWERTTCESQEQFESLAGEFGEWVWPPIPLDVKAREAPAHGQTLWEYAGRCRALDGVEVDGRVIGGYRQVLRRLLA